MDWMHENAKDEQLLAKLDLAPLAVDGLTPGKDVAALIDGHNTRLGQVASGLKALAADRERLGDFEHWVGTDSTTLLAERDRLCRAAWDFLQELRGITQQRRQVLAQVENWLGAQMDELMQKREQAEERAAKDLSKERRELDRAVPASAAYHFGLLVSNHEAVQAVTARITAAQAAFDVVGSTKQRLSGNMSDVAARQREVFRSLMQ